MVTHVFNTSTQEVESSRTPGLHSSFQTSHLHPDTLSQKKTLKNKQTKKKKNWSADLKQFTIYNMIKKF
jgi:hypothetical protein